MAASTGRLSDRERALLDFERDWSLHQGCKESAISRRFGFSAARYYQLLTRVLERPEALDYDPLTVRRLRRRRAHRARKATPSSTAGPRR